MILQSLVNYYEVLAEKNEVPRIGWSVINVSYALEINLEGELIGVYPLKNEVERGKKKVLIPRTMTMPARVKKTVGVESNFLCENATYFLGIADEKNAERTKKCFEAAKELHNSLLNDKDDDFCRAICSFFNNWDISSAKANPLFADYVEDFGKGANLTFMYDNQYPQNNRVISSAWQEHYDDEEDTAEKMRCLITGNMVVPQATHPSIKGIYGAQSSGAALVSFNADAYCSFERNQNINAPVGKYASFAYTTVLNNLISDKEHVKRIGDTTVLYWAEDAVSEYQNCFSDLLEGADDDTMSNKDIDSFMNAIAQGNNANWNGIPLKPDNHFYILGISPNAARLSVRFFIRDSFGNVINHLQEHYERMNIVSDNTSKFKNIPLWVLLRETVNENSRNKSALPQMAGDTLKSILTGSRYPATLYNQIQIRIRADRKINRTRAAIIKAYLLRNTDTEIKKEALTVELNENTTYQPYVLGRLFAVLEAIQNAANPGINTTIKDKYFSSACATPSITFPTLINLSNNHLKKIKDNNWGYPQKLTKLLSMISESYPKHHTLEEQGVFQLGYYHQTQKRFEKKINNEEEK